MEPMLKEDRDIVVIRATGERLKPLDVAFYKRGDQYILHRVMSVKDGIYYIRGDNTYVMERVPFDDVLGILVSFQRKGRNISTDNTLYRLYSRIWTGLYPVRVVYVKSRHLAGRFLRKIKVLK